MQALRSHAPAVTIREATRHYTVAAAGKKAGAEDDRVPLYCERIVNTNAPLFVRDSREDAILAGNEDEIGFGLSNYLGVAVHDESGAVAATAMRSARVPRRPRQPAPRPVLRRVAGSTGLPR